MQDDAPTSFSDVFNNRFLKDKAGTQQRQISAENEPVIMQRRQQPDLLSIQEIKPFPKSPANNEYIEVPRPDLGSLQNTTYTKLDGGLCLLHFSDIQLRQVYVFCAGQHGVSV